jgi:hypothetical protein
MAQRIVELAAHRRPELLRDHVARDPSRLPDVPAPSLHFWKGASKNSYVHSVYRLIDCPEIPPAVCVLAELAPNGRRTVLDVVRVEHDAPSLNLAEIRQRAATIGAKEVHVHFLADTPAARRITQLDLRAGLLRALGEGPRRLDCDRD